MANPLQTMTHSTVESLAIFKEDEDGDPSGEQSLQHEITQFGSPHL